VFLKDADSDTSQQTRPPSVGFGKHVEHFHGGGLRVMCLIYWHNFPWNLSIASGRLCMRMCVTNPSTSCTSSAHQKNLPPGKALDVRIVKHVQASRTFDSDECDGITNLDYGCVQNVNKWRAHVISCLSDEITRILDMSQNQRKMDELYVPARGLRNRAISKIESFIPNFEAVVADASRVK
jgi:hypothetical protein